ncbi:hypothetical protein ColKHC_11239 [Colletotrichum higginsianum]|nr:hypothetical protein ColKHC_11239 [Colletotrichum higginsianum]
MACKYSLCKDASGNSTPGRTWFKCTTCDGKGRVWSHNGCGSCYGDGYFSNGMGNLRYRCPKKCPVDFTKTCPQCNGNCGVMNKCPCKGGF